MKYHTILLIAFLFLDSCSAAPSSVIRPSTTPSITSPLVSATFVPEATVTPMNSSGVVSRCEPIAFTLADYQLKQNPDIYTVCSDGSKITRLTSDPDFDESAAWSPDGTMLAFVSNRSSTNQVYTMKADGNALVQITTDYDNSLPVWLPDGQYIAFRTTDEKGLWWWRKIQIDGSNVVSVTQPSYDFFFQTLAWSPDGTRIAYMSLVEQKLRNDGASQIHVKNIDGSNDRALTHDTWENINPVWSPDGKRLAFLSERDGIYNVFALYVMDADGAGVQRLSKPQFSDTSTTYSWAPDGQHIALADSGNITSGNIQVYDLSGRVTDLLDLQTGETAFGPAWKK